MKNLILVLCLLMTGCASNRLSVIPETPLDCEIALAKIVVINGKLHVCSTVYTTWTLEYRDGPMWSNHKHVFITKSPNFVYQLPLDMQGRYALELSNEWATGLLLPRDLRGNIFTRYLGENGSWY